MKRALLCVFFLILFFLIYTPPISAHPLDEIGNIKLYDQTQTLEIAPENAKLKIDLTFYAVEKIKVWESIDSNRDQVLTADERSNWMKKGQEASWLEKDGNKFIFNATDLNFPDYYDFFSSKPANVSIEFVSDIKTNPDDDLTYHYKGKDKALDEITFKAQGNSGLAVRDLNKLDPDTVTFKVDAGTQEEDRILGLKTSNRLSSFLNKYVKVDKIPARLALIALLAAFAIGTLHALTPGHGKAIVAGYLVGEKGTVWHAIQLGTIITITHTSSVFLLGLAAMFLTRYIVPAEIIKWMNLVSGFLVTGFGIYLLIRRVKETQHHRHEHHHHDDDEETLSWKSLVPLGISGGIVPCVDALAILIVAISLGKVLFGITLLIFFSLGLASALIMGGVAVVIAKGKAVKRITNLAKYEHSISIASALVVTLLGVAIMLNMKV